MAHLKENKQIDLFSLGLNRSVEERLFHNWEWSPSMNRGKSWSPRQLAAFWGLPARTVQRWAEAGKIPDRYSRGSRLLIRRTRASYEWMRSAYQKASARASRAYLRTPEHIALQPQINAYRQSLRLTMALRSWSINDPVETWPQAFRENKVDMWSAVFADHEKAVFDIAPERYGLIATAATLMLNGRFSIKRVASQFGVSRRTFYRKLDGISSAEIKRGAKVLLNAAEENGSIGKIRGKKVTPTA